MTRIAMLLAMMLLLSAGGHRLYAQENSKCRIAVSCKTGIVSFDDNETNIYGYGIVYCYHQKDSNSDSREMVMMTTSEQVAYFDKGSTVVLKIEPSEGHIIRTFSVWKDGVEKEQIDGLDHDFALNESKEYVFKNLEDDLEIKVSFIDYNFYYEETEAEGLNYRVYPGPHTAETSRPKDLPESDGTEGVTMESFVIPESVAYRNETYPVTTIGAGTFQNAKIGNVVIPPSVKRIKWYAFEGCQMDELVIPSSITNIDTKAFANCLIESVIFPEQMGSLTIGKSLFASYEESRPTGTKHVELPKDMEVIPYQMFYCSLLEDIQIPASVKVIERQAFEYTPISSLEIPEGVTEVQYQSFFGCEKLKALTLPASLRTVGQEAFGNTALDTLRFLGTIPPEVERASAFGNPWGRKPHLPVLVVPSGCKDSYQNTPGWNECEIMEEHETTAINTGRTVSSDGDEYYSVTGRRIPDLKKGLNLIRKRDGTTIKVLR